MKNNKRAALLLALVLSFASVAQSGAMAASPSLVALTAAHNQLAENPATASAQFEQTAQTITALGAADGAAAADIIAAFNAWASTPENQTAYPALCSIIFTSALRLSGAPAVVAAQPNLYASILVSAQKFADSQSADDQQVAALNKFLNLAMTVEPPLATGLNVMRPTAD